VFILALPPPLACTLEASSGILANPQLVEPRAEIRSVAHVRGGPPWLNHGIPLRGSSHRGARVLDPQPRSRPPDEAGQLIKPFFFGGSRPSRGQRLSWGNAAATEATSSSGVLSGPTPPRLHLELRVPDIGRGGDSRLGPRGAKPRGRRDERRRPVMGRRGKRRAPSSHTGRSAGRPAAWVCVLATALSIGTV
jgi:hypothetical protein